MKKGLTELVFILDRSGSMAGLESDTVGGFDGMIEQQKEAANWEFIFLGANIDAVETAKQFGIDEDHAVNYVPDAQGVRYSSALILEATSAVRAGAGINRKWKEKAEADYQKRGVKKG